MDTANRRAERLQKEWVMEGYLPRRNRHVERSHAVYYFRLGVLRKWHPSIRDRFEDRYKNKGYRKRIWRELHKSQKTD